MRHIEQWHRRGARLGICVALPLAFVIAMLPDQPGPQFSQADKVIHAGVFLVFALLAHRGWPQRGAWHGWPLWLLAYGAAIELAQWLLPWRDASVLDWLADAAGIAFGVLLVARERRLGRRAAAQ